MPASWHAEDAVAVDIPALLRELAELVADYRGAQATSAATEDNFRCENCENCHLCRFCSDCQSCQDCTYCEACQGCEKCNRCRGCETCTDSAQLEHCRGCERSQHLLVCLDCSECSHCIACVGLVGEEYCILNRRYDRKGFFRLARALKKYLEATGKGEVFDADASAASGSGSGFIIDSLRRIRGKVQQPGGAASAATDGGNEEPIDDSDDPWLEEARVAVERVDAAPSIQPPAYGVVTWHTRHHNEDGEEGESKPA